MKKQQRELARWRQRYERAEQKLDITTQVRCIERALACVQAGGEDADNFWGERIRLLFWAALQALAQGRGKRLIELLRYFDPDRLDQINLFRGYRRYVGQAYLAMGQGERAAAELRAYLQKYPDDEEARIYLARACGELPRGERPWLLPVGDYTPAEVRQFPVFINVRDRLAGLQRLVTWLQRVGQANIILLDNASTYPPLLQYLAQAEGQGLRVVHLPNLGYKAPWQSGVLQKLGIKTPYLYTDPDVVPAADCPLDLVQRCYDVLRRHPELDKVGPALRTRDITCAWREQIQRDEANWQRLPVEPGLIYAPIDTTLALYRGQQHYSLAAAARLAPPCELLHLPWYYQKDEIPADERYYREHADHSSSLVNREREAGKAAQVVPAVQPATGTAPAPQQPAAARRTKDPQPGRVHISACAIVKNEARDLPRWLHCMQALADEIVVVDTGSTDATVSLAEAAGARVVFYPWHDDFAAAKNFAIEQAQGDWVLLLDADEYFPEAQWPAVRAAIAHYDAQYEVIGLICDWLNFDEDNHDRQLDAGYQIRIFRRLPDLRYERPIHEALRYRGKEHRIFTYVPGLAIHHTGYSTKRAADKTRRNIAILLAEQAAGRGTPDDDYYLAECYHNLGEYEQAIRYAERVVHARNVSNGGANSTYMLWIHSLMQLQRPAAEIRAVLAEARQRFPQMAAFLILAGELDWREGDYLQAEKDYRQALALRDKFQRAHDAQAAGRDDDQQMLHEVQAAQKQLLIDDVPALLPLVYTRLAQLARWQGRTEQALQAVGTGLDGERHTPALCQELLRLLAGVPDADCIAALNRIYDKRADAPFLLQVLDGLPHGGRPRVQLYYYQQARQGQSAGPAVSSGTQYRWAGRLAASVSAFVTGISALTRLGRQAAARSAATGEILPLLCPAQGLDVPAWRQGNEPPQAEPSPIGTPAGPSAQPAAAGTAAPAPQAAGTGAAAPVPPRGKVPEHPLDYRQRHQLFSQLETALEQRRWQQAIALATRLQGGRPREREMWNAIMAAYIDGGDAALAQAGARDYAARFPHDGICHFYCGRAALLGDDWQGAERHFQAALADRGLRGWYRGAVCSIYATLCRKLGRAAEAARYYQISARYKDLAHGQAAEYSNYLFNLHYLAKSQDFMLQAAQGYGALFCDVKPYQHDRARHARHPKIRVGYISPDLHFHVVAFFSYAFLHDYDHDRFAVYCYTDCIEDAASEGFKGMVDVWRNVRGLAPDAVAAQVYRDEIDILFDLAGHTAGNFLPVLARKPAPVQLSGIGYFDTTGLPAVDYFLADPYTDPITVADGQPNDAYFTEKLLRLPHSHFCFMWHDDPPAVGEAPCLRKGYVTFGSFNNFTKVTDDMLQRWGVILQRVPGSRLCLKAGIFNHAYGRQVAEQRLRAAGIDLARVTLAGTEAAYLQRYADIDIALDTYPYPGGGTTCDALYMGVPVLTLVGRRHNARFGYSLLMNAGLPELCAFTPEEYVAKAVALADDKARLQHYRQTLRAQLCQSPVMQAGAYMQEVEAAYTQIFQRWLQG